MLGKTKNSESHIITIMTDILAIEQDDGLVFDSSSISSEKITEDADYEGVRILFKGKLDSAKINMQIDIGFGDIVFPEPELTLFPTLLELPAPMLMCYSRESVIAEKFEAMLKFAELNSRMKDFYDIWILSKQFDFDGKKLGEALRFTLANRDTEVSEKIVAFSMEFINAKQSQWLAKKLAGTINKRYAKKSNKKTK